MTLPDGELEVARLEKSALTGRQSVLIDAGKDLFGRARDDAALRPQARYRGKAGDESERDEERERGAPFCGRKMSMFVVPGEEQVQGDGPQSLNEDCKGFLSLVRAESLVSALLSYRQWTGRALVHLECGFTIRAPRHENRGPNDGIFLHPFGRDGGTPVPWTRAGGCGMY